MNNLEDFIEVIYLHMELKTTGLKEQLEEDGAIKGEKHLKEEEVFE